MPAHAAKLRYPYGRVLLGRTKLAYVHLRNLIGDAKRDRTARVAGYVAIWLPEDFIVLFLREGEVVNAVSATPRGTDAIAISSALARIPAEPEFGEIAFYEAPVELLVCMYHTMLFPPEPWPADLVAADPRVLFPHLRDTKFSGVVEVVNRDTANYLVLHEGLIEQTYVTEDNGAGRTELLARVFGPPSPRPKAQVRGWPGPLRMPAQAPAALVAAYRELVDRMYAELGSYGVPVPSAVGERVRDGLMTRHPALRRFAAGAKQEDPSDDGEDVTAAVAAWVTDTIREALDGDDDVARSVATGYPRPQAHAPRRRISDRVALGAGVVEGSEPDADASVPLDEREPPAGSLYVVSTPIGNLRDITLRAIDILRSVDLILAEDTRHSRHLLDHHGIGTPMYSYHEHNEARATATAIARLRDGRDVALISDAGTPLVSDPGARLVRAAAEAGILVVPIPGPSAVLAALVASAIGGDRFTFFGFLARKGRERDEALRDLSSLQHTAVLYEAPNRVAATLAEIAGRGDGERRAVVARELTKQFEEVRRGTVVDLAAYYESSPPRGEVVIVLEGVTLQPVAEDELRSRARSLRAAGLSARDVAAALVREDGASRNLAYRLAHEA